MAVPVTIIVDVCTRRNLSVQDLGYSATLAMTLVLPFMPFPGLRLTQRSWRVEEDRRDIDPWFEVVLGPRSTLELDSKRLTWRAEDIDWPKPGQPGDWDCRDIVDRIVEKLRRLGWEICEGMDFRSRRD